MRILRSFTSIDDAALYLRQGNPDLESDFFIDIYSPYDTNHFVAPIVGFSFPEVGVSFTSGADLYGHAVPSLKVSSIQVTAIHACNDLSNIIGKLWKLQYSDGGALSYEYDANPVNVSICKKDGTRLLFCSRCHFTYPTPSVNIQSAGISTYKFNITFDSYSLSI